MKGACAGSVKAPRPSAYVGSAGGADGAGSMSGMGAASTGGAATGGAGSGSAFRSGAGWRVLAR